MFTLELVDSSKDLTESTTRLEVKEQTILLTTTIISLSKPQTYLNQYFFFMSSSIKSSTPCILNILYFMHDTCTKFSGEEKSMRLKIGHKTS